MTDNDKLISTLESINSRLTNIENQLGIINNKIEIENWRWKGNVLFHSPITDILSGFYFEESPSRKEKGYYILLIVLFVSLK